MSSISYSGLLTVDQSIQLLADGLTIRLVHVALSSYFADIRANAVRLAFRLYNEEVILMEAHVAYQVI
jgi:hypothetical protein